MFFNFLQSYPNPLTRFVANGGTLASGGEQIAVMGPRVQRNERPTGLYPVSTLIIIALISFLVGSLFRSLLSPADFIYVVRDIGEAEEAQVVGWREMRRLFEVKYIVGGWDFQIAVVRRH